MDLYAYLILTLICLSPTFAECPDRCRCTETRTRSNDTSLHVHCDDLPRLPRDLITRGVTELLLRSSSDTVLSNIGEGVENVMQLNALVLADSHISKIEVNSLQGFYSLDYLDLSKNNISHIPNGLFESSPNLKELELSYNPYLILPENGFGTIGLEHLHIARCNLKEIPANFFDSMPILRILHLQGNHIGHLGTSLVSNLQKMAFVDFQNNNLTAFQPEIVDILNVNDAGIDLHGNPFRCDCQFRDGVEWFAWYVQSLRQLKCVLPSDYDGGSVDQEAFLDSLDCDVSKNEVETVASVSNSGFNLNVTSYDNSNESTKANNTELDNGNCLTVNDDMNNMSLRVKPPCGLLLVLLALVLSLLSLFFVVALSSYS